MPDVVVPVKDENPVKEFDAQVKTVPLRALFRYADFTDWALMIFGAVNGMAMGTALPLFSIVLGGLFDELNAGGESAFAVVSKFSLYFVYIGLGAFVTSCAQVACFTIASERITIRLREIYLDAALKQDISWYDTNNSGELASKIAENTVVIREALGEKLGALFQFGAMFVAGFAVGFAKSWKLTLVICACAPLLAISGAFMMKAMADMTTEGLGAYAKAGAVAEEAISLIRTVSGLGVEKQIEDKYDVHLREAERAGIRKAKITGLGFGFTMGVYFMTYSVGFWYGSVLVRDDRIAWSEDYPPLAVDNPANLFGEYCQAGATFASYETVNATFGEEFADFAKPTRCYDTVFESDADVCSCALCGCGCYAEGAPACTQGGDIVLVFFAVVMGSFALGQASPSLSALTSGKAAASVIYAVIDRVPEVDCNDDKGDKPGTVVGAFSLKDIAFHYPSRPDAPIFKSFNLEIPAGDVVALVGGSGSGKSTIVALLTRFYDPNAGSISLDGKDLRDLNVGWLRNQIGLVGQEPTLFATTIAQNIAYGWGGFGVDETPTQAQIEDAAKKSNAHDFIMGFPDGYNTMVGERGASLSGGQKQRIAIARAIIRDPSVILLDEATSALDNVSEAVVQEALDKLMALKRRTTVVIAHRLTTVRHADKIVVMQHGEILEQGNHDELMKIENGHYAMLIAATSAVVTGNKELEDDIDVSEAFNVVEMARQSSASEVTMMEGDSRPTSPSSSGLMSVESQIRKIASARVSSRKESISKEVQLKESEKKEKTSKKEKKKSVPLSRLWEFTKADWWVYIPGILSAAVNGAQMPVFAVLFSNIINAFYVVTIKELDQEAAFYAILFVVLGVVTFLGNFFQNITFGYIGERMTTRLRRALFHNIIHQEVGFFDMPENSTGAITSNLASDAALVKASISDRLAVTIMNLMTAILGLSIAFYYGWELSLVLLALFPVIALSGILQFKAMKGFTNQDSELMAASGQVLAESISGVRTVSAFGMRKRIVELYKSLLEGPAKLAVWKGIVGGLGFGFSQAVMFFTYAAAFAYGGYLIDNAGYTFDKLLSVFFAVIMSAMGLGQASSFAPDMAKAGTATDNVFSLLERKSKINSSLEDGEKVESINGDIKLSSVDFSYPSRPDAKVFDGVNLEIQPGTTVALVGQSGSGKSTIVQLLERFYDPDTGSVTVDGKELYNYHIKSYRSHVGLVSQEPNLFTGTIAENIAMGLPNRKATQQEIEEAAKSANAYNFIMEFPDKFETTVGENGGQLSGGQKQRVAIARAIIRDPSILLLDEATSALDTESERIVQQALDNLLKEKKRSTVVVAHRLSTIKNADKIVVVDQGKIVEQGSHKQLMATGVYYPKLYKKQQEKDHK